MPPVDTLGVFIVRPTKLGDAVTRRSWLFWLCRTPPENTNDDPLICDPNVAEDNKLDALVYTSEEAVRPDKVKSENVGLALILISWIASIEKFGQSDVFKREAPTVRLGRIAAGKLPVTPANTCDVVKLCVIRLLAASVKTVHDGVPVDKFMVDVLNKS